MHHQPTWRHKQEVKWQGLQLRGLFRIMFPDVMYFAAGQAGMSTENGLHVLQKSLFLESFWGSFSLLSLSPFSFSLCVCVFWCCCAKLVNEVIKWAAHKWAHQRHYTLSLLKLHLKHTALKSCVLKMQVWLITTRNVKTQSAVHTFHRRTAPLL